MKRSAALRAVKPVAPTAAPFEYPPGADGRRRDEVADHVAAKLDRSDDWELAESAESSLIDAMEKVDEAILFHADLLAENGDVVDSEVEEIGKRLRLIRYALDTGYRLGFAPLAKRLFQRAGK